MIEQTTFAARASVVNRTHRVLREQALSMREQKSRTRSLWLPLAICSLLLAVVCYAVWGMMADYYVDYFRAPTGVPDASSQLAIFMLWSLPVSAVLLGMLWMRRTRQREQNN